MNSGDISIPATGLSAGGIYVLLYVYRYFYWNTEHFCSHGLSIEVLIPYLIFVFCASVLVFLSLEHLVYTTMSNQFLGDHLGLMFYSSSLSLQRKLSILNNIIGLFIIFFIVC